jgi:hypothetical protein
MIIVDDREMGEKEAIEYLGRKINIIEDLVLNLIKKFDHHSHTASFSTPHVDLIHDHERSTNEWMKEYHLQTIAMKEGLEKLDKMFDGKEK